MLPYLDGSDRSKVQGYKIEHGCWVCLPITDKNEQTNVYVYKLTCQGGIKFKIYIKNILKMKEKVIILS